MRLKILDELGDEFERVASGGPTPRGGQIRRIAALAAAVLSVLAVIVALLPGDGPDRAEPAAAAELLQRAATSAAAGGDRLPGPDEYTYAKIVVTQRSEPPAAARTEGPPVTEIEYWLNAKGDGGVVFGVDAVIPIRRFKPVGPRRRSRPGPESPVVPFDLTPRQLRDLPGEPHALKRRLGRLPGLSSHPHEVFVAATELLRSPLPLSAEVRAALYSVLAELPGVRSLGVVTDSAGRRGAAVASRPAGGREMRLIFDPDTSDFLAAETRLRCTGNPRRRRPRAMLVDCGPIQGRVVIVTSERRASSGVVGAVGARP